MCLNVCQFEANNDKLSTFLSAEHSEIVCLQEVTRSVDGRAKPENASYDTINTTLHTLEYIFYAPIWVLNRIYLENFHGKDAFDFSHGGLMEFGNYIRSKYKIIKGQNMFVENHFTYVTDWSKWPDEDYRGVQVTDLEVKDGRMLRILNYHGIWSKNKSGNERTLEACRKIKKLALEVNYPSIICGDFNLFPNTESIRQFDDEFVNLLNKYEINTTRPEANELSNEKRNVVDYIIVSKDIKVSDFKVLKSDVSDHLPLVLDFEI